MDLTLIAIGNLHTFIENELNRTPAHAERTVLPPASSRENIDIHLLFCIAHRAQP